MKEISEFFQSERKKRGLTLESVSELSGISVAMLGFFEAGDFESIGAELIILNIIRGYCKIFEIDHEPYLREFSPELEKLRFQETGIRKYGQKMKLLRKRSRMLSLPLLLFVMASILVMYGGAWVSEKRARLFTPPPADRISSQEDLPPELRQKLTPPSGIEPGRQRFAARNPRGDADLKEADKAIREAEKNLSEAGKPSSGPGPDIPENGRDAANPQKPGIELSARANEPPSPDSASPKVGLSNSMEVLAEDNPAASAEAGKPFRFSVDADAKTWVQVTIDDKETRSAMLMPGDKREWTAQKGMRVVIGNAGGVIMKWEDQAIRAPREPGRVLRFKLPEQISMVGD